MKLSIMGDADSLESPVFRPMKLDDIKSIYEIEKEAFPTPWTPGAFHNELVNNHFAHYLVMEMGSVIAGYGGMWIIMNEAHVTNIAVRSQYRGRKLGEQLLRQLWGMAFRGGAHKITLEVRITNRIAQNLYEKLGFRSVGIRKNYYTDNNEDALIMWADIHDEHGGRRKPS